MVACPMPIDVVYLLVVRESGGRAAQKPTVRKPVPVATRIYPQH